MRRSAQISATCGRPRLRRIESPGISRSCTLRACLKNGSRRGNEADVAPVNREVRLVTSPATGPQDFSDTLKGKVTRKIALRNPTSAVSLWLVLRAYGGIGRHGTLSW